MADERDAFVTVAVCYSLPAAVVARSALEARGIDAHLIGANYASVNWFHIVAIGGLCVRVSAADEANARALLSEGETPPASESAALRRMLERSWLMWPVAFAGFWLGIPFWVRHQRD